MKDVQSIILKQNTDDSKKRRAAFIRKKKATRMSAYKVTTGIVISFLTAIISFVGLAGLCIYSALNKGNAGIFVGIIGIILFFANVAGFIFGILERSNDEAKQKYVLLGTIFNLILMIIYMLLYLI